MLASFFSCSRTGRVMASARDSAHAQSTRAPSRIAAATSSSIPSGKATPHLLREPDECALRRFAGRILRGLAQHVRQLRVVEAQFNLGNDGVAILRLQPREGTLVGFRRLPADRFLERRRGVRRFETVEARSFGPSCLAPQLVEHPVANGLTQIGLQGADAPRLEYSDSLKRLQKGVLDKVVGIDDVARAP